MLRDKGSIYDIWYIYALYKVQKALNFKYICPREFRIRDCRTVTGYTERKLLCSFEHVNENKPVTVDPLLIEL